MPSARGKARGFTLIELMIVVTIISILASVAIPKFANMVLKAQEGSAKANLGSVRSALSIYYADNQGNYPTCAVGANSGALDELIPKYMSAVPPLKNGLHPPTSAVYCDFVLVGGSVHDGQGWYYDGASPTDASFGTLWVACDHTDTNGKMWTVY